MFPVIAGLIRSTFRVGETQYSKAVTRIEELLSDIDMRLADGRQSILGGGDINYTDITFAALSGLWLVPENYAAGRAKHHLVARSDLPAPMRGDIERWSEDYPRATAFVKTLYREQRLPATAE